MEYSVLEERYQLSIGRIEGIKEECAAGRTQAAEYFEKQAEFVLYLDAVSYTHLRAHET